MSCTRTQHGAPSEDRAKNLLFRSPMLYNQASVPLGKGDKLFMETHIIRFFFLIAKIWSQVIRFCHSMIFLSNHNENAK